MDFKFLLGISCFVMVGLVLSESPPGPVGKSNRNLFINASDIFGFFEEYLIIILCPLAGHVGMGCSGTPERH